ncbi:unnamed protein product, partial [Allacma fusca]
RKQWIGPTRTVKKKRSNIGSGSGFNFKFL